MRLADQEMPVCPPNGLVTTMDVARQHHHIGSGGHRLSRLELNVHIGNDLDGGHVIQSSGGCGSIGTPSERSRVSVFLFACYSGQPVECLLSLLKHTA